MNDVGPNVIDCIILVNACRRANVVTTVEKTNEASSDPPKTSAIVKSGSIWYWFSRIEQRARLAPRKDQENREVTIIAQRTRSRFAG